MRNLHPHRNVVEFYGVCVDGERLSIFAYNLFLKWIIQFHKMLVYRWWLHFASEVFEHFIVDLFGNLISTKNTRWIIEFIVWRATNDVFETTTCCTNCVFVVFDFCEIESWLTNLFYPIISRLLSMLRWVFDICTQRTLFIVTLQVLHFLFLYQFSYLNCTIFFGTLCSAQCVYRRWFHGESWRFRYVEIRRKQRGRQIADHVYESWTTQGKKTNRHFPSFFYCVMIQSRKNK